MKQIIGIADMKISSNPKDLLITYALGSCLGITLYDPISKVGGLLHLMLPNSTTNPEKAVKNPYMFVDTGVPSFFKECYKRGAVRERLVVKVAGGAATQKTAIDSFKIGKRNFLMLRKLFWKNHILIESQDVGKDHSRTMSLEIATGDVIVKINNEDKLL